MKREYIVPIVITALAFLGSSCLAAVDSSPNPYSEISNRNAFALHQIPPPPKIQSSPTPATKITLTGITTVLPGKIALLKVHSPSKPGELAKDASYALAEGEAQDGIKIIEINEHDATVKVDCRGDISTLTFASNSAESRVAPPQDK